ncbi:MAG: hypothetical protein P8O79_06945 [Halieaceae bacterium]|nr:hypothetical protein [Halieaceae bacterium]
MKSLRNVLGAIALCGSAFVWAEPVMTLITVNTDDPAGYAGWAKSNAEKISKANGAMAMGLCSPTSGAQKMGDHYLWSFFGSQEAAWSADPMNPIQRDAVASMNVEREVRTWDNWRIVRAAQTADKGYYYNLYIRTDDPAGYIAAVDELHAEMKKRGFDVSMQVFMGDTGETAGMIMTSFGASDAAEVGRMMDARTESWVAKIIAGLQGKREMVHGFALICETYYAAEM